MMSTVNRDVVVHSCSFLHDKIIAGVFAANPLEGNGKWLTGPVGPSVEAPNFTWLMFRLPALLRNLLNFIRQEDAHVCEYSIASNPMSMKHVRRDIKNYANSMGEAFDEHVLIIAYYSPEHNSIEYAMHVRRRPVDEDCLDSEAEDMALQFFKDMVDALGHSYEVTFARANMIPPNLQASISRSSGEESLFGKRKEG